MLCEIEVIKGLPSLGFALSDTVTSAPLTPNYRSGYEPIIFIQEQ